VAGLYSSILGANTAWQANAATQQGLITTLQSNAGVQADAITGANAAIVTANTAMKAYVDAVTTAWTANAVSQQSAITTLQSQVNGPVFMAYNSTNQSLTTGTANVVYSTTTVNTNGLYNTSTGIFQPNVAGYYQVNASMLPEQTAGVANASFYIGLYKNGVINALAPSTTITTTWGTIGISALSRIVYFNGTTDSINIKIGSSITSGTWRTGISVANFFEAIWIRGT
jgi:hypothetical protein